MEGRGECRTRMRALLVALATMLVVVGLVPAGAQASPFPDVANGAWYAQAVTWAHDNGVMNGYADGRFGPDDPLLREQEAAVLYNYLADGAGAKACTLRDVARDAWYTRNVDWAVESGTMLGYDGGDRFGVGDPLTREQLAVVMARVCKADLSKVDRAKFDALPDHGSTSDWAEASVAWAVEHGVVNGFAEADGTRTLAPQGTVTRAQMAGVMMNAVTGGVLKKDGSSTKTDDGGKTDSKGSGSKGGRYTVRFVSLEGGTERVISQRSYRKGDRVTVPFDPRRSDYEFRSWNSDDDGSGTALPDGYTCTGDATWYVVWAPESPADEKKDGVSITGVRYRDGVKASEGRPSSDWLSVAVSARDAGGIEAGDVVVFNLDDLDNATALKVTRVVRNSDGTVTITGEAPNPEDVYESAHIDASIPLDQCEVTPAEGVEVSAIGQADSGVELQAEHAANIPLDGMKFSLKVDAGHKSKSEEGDVSKSMKGFVSAELSGIKGTLVVTVDVEGARLKRFESRANLEAGTWKVEGGFDGKYEHAFLDFEPPILPGFTFTAEIKLSVDGKGSVSIPEYSYKSGDVRGFSLGDGKVSEIVVGGVTKDDSAAFVLDGTFKAGPSVEFGINALHVIKVAHVGDQYGFKAELKDTVRDATLTCQDSSAEFFSEVYVKSGVSFDFMEGLGLGLESKTSWEIGDISLWKKHRENGVQVKRCTWERYTVVFNADGGTGTMDDQVIWRGETAELSKNTFTRDGYAFAGWRDDDDNFYGDGEAVRDLAAAHGQVHLHAQWRVDESGDSDPHKPSGKVTVRSTAEDYSWADLSQISKEIAATSSEDEAIELAKAYNLTTSDGKLDGTQTKSFKLTDGTECSAQILGFRHDDLADGSGKAGISWIFKDAVGKRTWNLPRSSNLSERWNTEGGWEASDLRAYMNDDVYGRLPEDLQAIIRSVTKRSNNIGNLDYRKYDATEEVISTLVTPTSDKLWAPSMVELFGDHGGWGERASAEGFYSLLYFAEGYQYQLTYDTYVNDMNTHVHKVLAKTYEGDATGWWSRSVSVANQAEGVTDNGGTMFGNINYERGVVPGFCI